MPFGRGGVGNLQAVQHEHATVSADLEANHSSAGSDHRGTLPASYVEKNEQQYAHSGRGGAGNYYSPKELSETGRFSDAHRSHIPGDGTQPPASSVGAAASSEPPSYSTASTGSGATKSWGRGGAGNMSYGMMEDEERAARRKLQEDEAKEKLKAEVERGVGETLAMPQKAKLPAAEPL